MLRNVIQNLYLSSSTNYTIVSLLSKVRLKTDQFKGTIALAPSSRPLWIHYHWGTRRTI